MLNASDETEVLGMYVHDTTFTSTNGADGARTAVYGVSRGKEEERKRMQLMPQRKRLGDTSPSQKCGKVR